MYCELQITDDKMQLVCLLTMMCVTEENPEKEFYTAFLVEVSGHKLMFLSVYSIFFSLKSASRGTVNSMEKKSSVKLMSKNFISVYAESTGKS